MPSKNSINRPKNKNTARAKAQHKSITSRRRLQSDIVYGKVDSKKVLQKKLRATRLQAAHEKSSAKKNNEDGEGDVEMNEDGDETVDKIDTKKKKELRRAKSLQEQESAKEEQGGKEFKMDTSSGRGTTIGGPPSNK